MTKGKKQNRSSSIPDPPSGGERLRWLGPGFLWMVSAAGSGELLFTPRVGSLYGYALLWTMLAAVALKWFINGEVGRYTVCTGRTVIEGFSRLPGPRNWPLYVILLPQLFVAVCAVAGLAGSAATALIVAFPGNIKLWTIGSILASTALVIWGRFRLVERIATILAVLLSAAAVVSAVTVLENPTALAGGLVPQLPDNVDYEEVLPWLGFMLSGAAGMIWYSFWIQKKGYGHAGAAATRVASSPDTSRKLKGWVRQMQIDNTLAVTGTCIITIAFLILGVELLRPNGLVPEEDRVAEVLGQLLGQVWGPIGFWFMIVCIFVGFWDTVLSDQDGFGRMFAGGAKLLFKSAARANEETVRRLFVLVLVTILPLILYLLTGEPVALLKIAGAIEAIDIPVLTALILYLNLRELPVALRPSAGFVVATSLAGVFFLAFAVIYLLQITGSSSR